MKKNILVLIILSLFIACNAADDEKRNVKKSYFDLEGYFAKEELRLNTANPLIEKTVSVNNSAEHKSLKVADWKKELSIFTDADLNKTAWQGLFKVKKTPGMTLYSSDNEKIPVKSLAIHYKNGMVSGIKILLQTNNLLYNSNDTLSYFPDSLYEIQKTQHIKLLNEKSYRITGAFIK